MVVYLPCRQWLHHICKTVCLCSQRKETEKEKETPKGDDINPVETGVVSESHVPPHSPSPDTAPKGDEMGVESYKQGEETEVHAPYSPAPDTAPKEVEMGVKSCKQGEPEVTPASAAPCNTPSDIEKDIEQALMIATSNPHIERNGKTAATKITKEIIEVKKEWEEDGIELLKEKRIQQS